MNKALRLYSPATLLSLALLSGGAMAQDDIPREEKSYLGLYFTGLQHRSVGLETRGTHWQDGGSVVWGGHISEHFHVEIRGGFGDADIEIDGARLVINGYGSWYFGMHHPLTDWANIYGQFGFSRIQGQARLPPKPGDDPETGRPKPDPYAEYRHLEGGYPASTFSSSWLVGVDMELFSDTYFVLEGGRLFKDTESEVSTYQFSSGLRFEF